MVVLGQSAFEVRALQTELRAAGYSIAVTGVLDPVTRAEINLPPSGFVAGIYARNDVERAVYKAPANEVVNLAIGLYTPPVGTTLFIGSMLSKATIGQTVRELLPFYAVGLVVLAMMSYIPALTLRM